MKTIRAAVAALISLAGFGIAAGCGRIEVGISAAAGGPPAAEAGAAGAAAGAAGAAGPVAAGAASRGDGGAGLSAGGAKDLPAGGAAGDGGPGGAPSFAGESAGPSCADPDGAWQGCFSGQPCFVCASELAGYPLYLRQHPRCTSWYACDHSEQHAPCSSDCPAPGPEDQCDATEGNWAGCRGLGCYVCSELVADYPNYFLNHPFCISNGTCDGVYYTCSAACPAPSEKDR